jgi:chromosome segregation ATPase
VLSVICVGLWRLWSFSIDRNKELQSDITERDNSLQSLRDEFFKDRQKNLERIVRLDTQINELVLQINRLNESDLTQRQLNIELKSKVETIRQEFEAYRADAIGKRDELEQKVASLQRMLNDERTSKKQLGQELNAERLMREELQLQILEKQSEIAAQREIILATRKDNVKLTRDNQTLTKGNKMLIDQLDTVAERMAQYESDVQALNSRIDKLTATLEQLVTTAVNDDGDNQSNPIDTKDNNDG